MIHSTAIIEKGAVLDEGVSVGAYAVIEAGVRLGRNVRVQSHARLKGDTEIGEDTFVGTGALIGEWPQMAVRVKEPGRLKIGRNNVIREYATIHTSTSAQSATIVGDNNYLMTFSHLAHDCRLKDNIVLCQGSMLAGHVEVDDSAFISGGVTVHQFTRIGRLTMVGGLSRVNQDIPPFMMVIGDSRVWGINLVGLRRAKLLKKEIEEIKQAFTIIYRKKLSVKSALKRLESLNTEKGKELAEFISASKRGICGPKRSSLGERLFLDYPYLLRTQIPAYREFLKTRRGKGTV